MSDSEAHFNIIAKDYDYWKNKNKKYYNSHSALKKSTI